jgi:hypothetical protein
MNRQSQGLFEAPLRTPLPKDRVVVGTMTRILFVPFRRNLAEFRQEVRKSLGRYTTFRSDQGAFLDRLLRSEPGFEQMVRMQHSAMLQARPPVADSTPVQFPATFIYTPDFKRVTRITFP